MTHSPAPWDTMTTPASVTLTGSALTRQMARDAAPVPVPPVLATWLVEVGTDGRLYPAMRHLLAGAYDEEIYAGNAHAEAERADVPTCLYADVWEARSCVACEVEEGNALMVTYPRS